MYKAFLKAHRNRWNDHGGLENTARSESDELYAKRVVKSDTSVPKICFVNSFVSGLSVTGSKTFWNVSEENGLICRHRWRLALGLIFPPLSLRTSPSWVWGWIRSKSFNDFTTVRCPLPEIFFFFFEVAACLTWIGFVPQQPTVSSIQTFFRTNKMTEKIQHKIGIHFPIINQVLSSLEVNSLPTLSEKYMFEWFILARGRSLVSFFINNLILTWNPKNMWMVNAFVFYLGRTLTVWTLQDISEKWGKSVWK